MIYNTGFLNYKSIYQYTCWMKPFASILGYAVPSSRQSLLDEGFRRTSRRKRRACLWQASLQSSFNFLPTPCLFILPLSQASP